MNDRERQPLTTADIAHRSDADREARETADRARYAPPQDGTPRERVALFPDHELNGLKSRWTEIQAEFVDEPRRSVEEADSLVASTIQRLAESFAAARGNLETQWARGSDASTEDLRAALLRYRSFFDRLLAV